jgi:hypothetical protein
MLSALKGMVNLQLDSKALEELPSLLLRLQTRQIGHDIPDLRLGEDAEHGGMTLMGGAEGAICQATA